MSQRRGTTHCNFRLAETELPSVCGLGRRVDKVVHYGSAQRTISLETRSLQLEARMQQDSMHASAGTAPSDNESVESRMGFSQAVIQTLAVLVASEALCLSRRKA
jgi:hypothetical protein